MCCARVRLLDASVALVRLRLLDFGVCLVGEVFSVVFCFFFFSGRCIVEFGTASFVLVGRRCGDFFLFVLL